MHGLGVAGQGGVGPVPVLDQRHALQPALRRFDRAALVVANLWCVRNTSSPPMESAGTTDYAGTGLRVIRLVD